MKATVTLETWILSASAKLGAIELVDHLNTGNLILEPITRVLEFLSRAGGMFRYVGN